MRLPFGSEPRRRARPHLERSLRLVRPELLARFRALVQGGKPWPFYLFGAAGCGKTRAALALCDHIPGSYYLTLEDIAADILDRRDGITWRYLPDYSLVVVDELATRRTAGDLEYTALKKIADAREDMAIVYISNVAPADLATVYDDRVASRILCGTVYHLDDRDRRRPEPTTAPPTDHQRPQPPAEQSPPRLATR